MSNFKNLRIGVRLAAGFALVIVAGLAVAVYGRAALGTVAEDLRLLADDYAVKVDQVRDIRDNVNIIARAVRTMALTDDAAMKADEARNIHTAKADNGRLFQALEDSIVSPEGKALLADAARARAAYNPTVAEAERLVQQGDPVAVSRHITGPMRAEQMAYLAALTKVIEFQEGLMREAKADAQATVATAGLVMLGVALAAALAGGLIA